MKQMTKIVCLTDPDKEYYKGMEEERLNEAIDRLNKDGWRIDNIIPHSISNPAECDMEVVVESVILLCSK